MSNGAKLGITGRLTKEPKQSTTQNGTTVVSFTVAVSTTKKVDEKYVANFYNVSAWGQVAEFIFPRITKGTMVQVYGDLILDTFTDKNGQERQSLNVRATDVIPLVGTVKKEEKEEELEGNPF